MHLLGRRKGRKFGDFVVKAFLIGLPLTWFVFALEITMLSKDKGHDGHLHTSAQDSQAGSVDSGGGPRDPAIQGSGKAHAAKGEAGDEGGKVPQGDDALGEPRDALEGPKEAGDGPRDALGEPRDTLDGAKEAGGGPRDALMDAAHAFGANLHHVLDVKDRFDPPKLGELGAPINMEVNELEAHNRARYDDGYSKHNFNEFASELISLQRAVPDFRPEECRYQDFFSGVTLQPVSVIMCFYNEAWSTLLRSVHSVIDRSPPSLLKEIILVDDFSDADHLKGPLEDYMRKWRQVKIVRMPERVGLVKARLRGVGVAKAPILLFLDSHIECGEGWLEPLLYEVSKNPNVAVTPIIDIIDKDTFSVVQAVESIGVVDLRHMTFTWSRPTPRISSMRASPAHPFLSPTMAGGLFAINKKFFLQLGTWDPGLHLWGGENLELSFKLWMCGGAIWIHPCSRVSHIFRDKSPYLKTNVDRIVKGNAARVAEVWLDDYKKFFFQQEVYDPSIYGDVSDRKQLRADLGCHSFKWYLDHVYPELFVEGTGKHLGHLRTVTGLCTKLKDDQQTVLELTADCPSSIVWQTTNTGEIRYGNLCLAYQDGYVMPQACDSQENTQAFAVNQQGDDSAVSIVHRGTGLCMAAAETYGALASIHFAPCLYGDRRQIWLFDLNPNAM